MPNDKDGRHSALLEVRNLKTHFMTEDGLARAVDGISFSLPYGGKLGIVGESGCGKSVTSLSIMHLVPSPGRIVAGQILFEGEEMSGMSERDLCRIRGKEIAMIFQDPMTSLNPVYTVGSQVIEAIRYHQKLDARTARDAAIEMLDLVGISSPKTSIDYYPHQMSGGMRQRVMIAMALSCRPKLLIADEPTTALDVTIQAQILSLMNQLQADLGTSIILITHDMGVIAEMVDTVAVMYAGKIVEKADVKSLFATPKHPYTLGLLASIPKLNEGRERLRILEGMVPSSTDFPVGCRFCSRCKLAHEICRLKEPPLLEVSPNHEAACWAYTGYLDKAIPSETGTVNLVDESLSGQAAEEKDRPRPERSKLSDFVAEKPLLQVEHLTKYFPYSKGMSWSRRGPLVKAVDDISFSVNRGETFSLVGESGCGKTTTGWLILRLLEATRGKVIFDDRDIFSLDRSSIRKLRRDMQIIFQDPYSSLNPRWTVKTK